MAPRRYLTLQDVISPERLNCSESTVKRMLARGEFIKPLRLSQRALRWDSVAVDQWMLEHADRFAKSSPR